MQPQRIDLGYATGFNDEVDSGKQGSVGANKPSMRSTAPGQAVKVSGEVSTKIDVDLD